jgi:hypothetical protein
LIVSWFIGGSLWVLSAWSSQTIEIKGAIFPTQQATESGRFKLQGAGILKWGLWFDLYAAAYYVDEANPRKRRLEIEYFVPIEAEQIRTAAERHLLKQQDADLVAMLKPALDRLHDALRDVDKGDRYALTLDGDQTLILQRNGNEVLRVHEPELGKAYLNLWLGENPLDEDLRLSLLGDESRS